jgi:hypothetical protein
LSALDSTSTYVIILTDLFRPAGGRFTVELAANRADTTLSYGGQFVTPWGDGKNHPDDYSMTNLGGYPATSGCLPSPNCDKLGRFIPVKSHSDLHF